MTFDERLIEQIIQKSIPQKPFADLINGFEEKLKNFDPIKNCFPVEEFFSGQVGLAGATKRLMKDGKIRQEWLREYFTKKGKSKIDVKGLYVFVHKSSAFYVGVSKGLIGRTLQHLKGHSHNTSTLAYNIGLLRYEILKKNKYTGGRKEFNFKADVTPVKEFLMKQKIAYLPVDNNEEMYLFEVYCAMHFQCFLNRFETH
jgi:predicted GIY-YIG superfamily endonuclease